MKIKAFRLDGGGNWIMFAKEEATPLLGEPLTIGEEDEYRRRAIGVAECYFEANPTATKVVVNMGERVAFAT